MASLADLAYVFDQQSPAGFTLAQLGLAGDFGMEQAQVASDRIGRNFAERAMPRLVSHQAARGAYNTSATTRKAGELVQDTGDTLSDLASRGAQAQAQLSANALLAQTGVRI